MRKVLCGVLVGLFVGTSGMLSPAVAWASPPKVTVAIRVDQVGGFIGPNVKTARLPDVVLYTDGRVLAQHDVTGSVKEMFQGHVTTTVLRSQIVAFTKAVKYPKGGWGAPSVADVPSTQVSVFQSGKKTTANVYALEFKTGNMSKEAIAARALLSKTIAALVKLAGKSSIYNPSTFEVWPFWVGAQSSGPGTETGLANPAAIFCLSQNGTLVAGKVLLDSPTPSPDLSIEYCHLSDGSFVEEWAYFYRASKTGIAWPINITAPKGVCASVAAKAFVSLLRTSGSKQWLLPNGSMVALTWRPVLPAEIACKR